MQKIHMIVLKDWKLKTILASKLHLPANYL